MPAIRKGASIGPRETVPAAFRSLVDRRVAATQAWQHSEHALQVHIITELRLRRCEHPDLDLLYAVPNGGERHRAVAAKLKAEGVRKGVPDLCLPVARGGYIGLYLELKKAKEAPSAEQWAWLQRLHEAGHRVFIANHPATAVNLILTYLNERPIRQ